MGIVNLPKTSQIGTNEWADVEDNDQALAAAINGNIEDANLASPPHGLYKTIFTVDGGLGLDAVAGTYLFQTGAAGAMSASPFTSSPITAYNPLFYFDDADYTVANKTLKLRLRAQVAANATAPAINFTFGLYPITVAGGADAMTYTAGTVVPGSTAALTTPSASTITQGNSGDFAFPVDGAYAFAVVTSGTIANNSAVSCHAQLQYRNT